MHFMARRDDFRASAGCIIVMPSTILQKGGGFGRRTSDIASLKGAP
jgi:hypothetical protein